MITSQTIGMQIDIEDVPWPIVLAGGAIFYGSALQLGYFKAIGIEFLSFAGVADWLFHFGVVLPFFFVFTLIASWLCRRVKAGVEQGEWFESQLWRYSRNINSLWGLLIFALAVAAMAYIDFDSLPTNIAVLFWIAIFPAAAILVVTQLAILLDSIEETGTLSVAILGWFLFNSWFVLFLLNEGITSTYAGRDCTMQFRTSEAVEVRFLRHVPAGYLYQVNGSTHFAALGEVERLSCSKTSKSELEQ